MRRLSAIRRRLASEEAGFTLAELLVVIAILSVMLGAIVVVLNATQRTAPEEQERIAVIQDTQAGVYRMTRELRHAYRVTANGQWSITALLLVNGTTAQVTYDCTPTDPATPGYRICTRAQGAAAAQPVIKNVVLVQPAGGGQPPSVFTYKTNAAGNINHVSVSVVAAAAGEVKTGYKHKITFRDGFYLRNVDSCGNQQPTACP